MRPERNGGLNVETRDDGSQAKAPDGARLTFTTIVDQRRQQRLQRPHIAQVAQTGHRRLPLIAYNFGFILFFVSKVNYAYGTHDVIFTQSYGRYALALFPLTIMIADGLRSMTPILRVIGVALLVLGIIAFSALYVLALTGP